MFSYSHVLDLERAAARAWPPQRIVEVAGWHLRLSGGGSRRANSVLPLTHDGTPLPQAIDAVEAQYRAAKQRCYFQVTSIAQPSGLDAALAARGYTHEEPCLLLAKPLSATAMPRDVEVSATPTADWLAVYTVPLDAARRAAAPAVLQAVPGPRAFLLLRRDGRPTATALAVLAPSGIALVECVATLPDARRSGAGHTIMTALEGWSAANGGTTAALQVIEGNTPARALYDRRGYVEAGRYHYRWKDVV